MEGSKKSYCKGIFYSFTDIPGALPVNTLGRGWFPTPDSRAIEPTTTKMSVITVPAINTNGLKPPAGHESVSQSVSRTASQEQGLIRNVPAHVLPFTLAPRPVLCPTLRILSSFTRAGETCPSSSARLDARAMARARIGGIGAYFLRSEA
jgi:hypothetical protein